MAQWVTLEANNAASESDELWTASPDVVERCQITHDMNAWVWISVSLRFCLPNKCEQSSCGTSKWFFKHDETAVAQRKMVSLSQYKCHNIISRQWVAVYTVMSPGCVVVSGDAGSKCTIWMATRSVICSKHLTQCVHGKKKIKNSHEHSLSFG